MSSRDEFNAPGRHAVVVGEQAEDLLALGRGMPLPEDRLVTVSEAVASVASTHPDAIAVRWADAAVSYCELLAWADSIAARLARMGAARGSRVAVLAEPSTAMVAAVLGVMRAGAAYVPIDPAQPDGHIKRMLDDAEVAAAVVTEHTAGRAHWTGVPAVRGDPRASVDGEASAVVDGATARLEDPAYLIYTSGSTGEPKGVLVEHEQLAASTLARQWVYPEPEVFLLVSPLAFDSSAAGLWGTLTSGGTVVVASSDDVRDPERLIDLIDRHAVTQLLCVPSLYRVVLDAVSRRAAVLDSLKTVVVAGEPLDKALVQRHFAVLFGRAALVNEYGPTEATVWAAYRRFDEPGPVSIGGPIPGALLYVLDDDMRPVPRGVEGELFIGGAGVARGYLGRPDETARAFLPDPFAPGADARMYRTGDLVCWTDDDTLQFIGRRDQQVKIRGHRVELGAVETALRSQPGVRDAVVVPNHARTQLAGFVVGSPALSPQELRSALAAALPGVMVPTRIEVLPALPQTVSGKIDRVHLAGRAEDQPSAEPAVVGAIAPRGLSIQTTALVAAAWAEVLGVTHVPTDVNFFDLGGHSLKMFELQDALERHAGVRPSVVSLFRHTTVAAQATLVSDDTTSADAGGGRGQEAAAERVRALRARRQRATREAL